MPIPIFPWPSGWFVRGIVAAIVCAGIADWLFFQQDAGASIAIFLTLLALVSIGLNPSQGDGSRNWIGWIAFAAGQLAVLENLEFLSLLFAVMGLAILVLIRQTSAPIAWWRLLPRTAWTIVAGPVALIQDCIVTYRSIPDRSRTKAFSSQLLACVIPVGLGALFLALFYTANPLIEEWINLIDPGMRFDPILFLHILFWIFIIVTIWPLMHVRSPRPRETARTNEPITGHAPAAANPDFFGTTATVRSLVFFNILFAVQTVTDVTYLWGGAALPNGMTYATYAHRGAYPLMVTALLAGAFVLASARSADSVPLIRKLLLVWTGQNVLLVLSSILRLNLYVATYSLTGWRVAAFIWMGLVAAGLCLIVVRLIAVRSSAWLMSANAVVVVATLYGTSFVDVPTVIAEYNVSHARECGGPGVPLDVEYLNALGPRARLAFDRCSARFDWASVQDERRYALIDMIQDRNQWVAWQRVKRQHWRSWSFREWRLRRYLANTQSTLPTP